MKSADRETEPREMSMPPDTTTAPRGRLSADDAAVLLIDHQAGLLSLVQDYSPDEFRNNVLALADTAKHFRLPTILTTSFEDGPNGVLMPELKAAFPDAPFIPRPARSTPGTTRTSSRRSGRRAASSSSWPAWSPTSASRSRPSAPWKRATRFSSSS